jgi:hypothetical protein
MLSRAAAVQDARRAARSVLDGCEHDGTLIAETDDNAGRTLPSHPRFERTKTRRLDAVSDRR